MMLPDGKKRGMVNGFNPSPAENGFNIGPGLAAPNMAAMSSSVLNGPEPKHDPYLVSPSNSSSPNETEQRSGMKRGPEDGYENEARGKKDGSQGVRKRNRAILSCQTCRQKKTRCNREMPCSQCVKNNVGHLCSYNYQKDGSSNGNELDNGNLNYHGVNEEIMILRKKVQELEAREASYKDSKSKETNIILQGSRSELLIGINPVCPSKDVIDINDTLAKVGKSKASFYFPKPLRQDPGLNVFWMLNSNPLVKRCNFTTLLSMTTLDPSTNYNNTVRILEKLQNQYGDQFIQHPFQGSIYNSKTIRIAITKYGKPLGHTINELYDDNESLLLSLQRLLPGKMILDQLIDRFFKKLYPFFPIVDEKIISAEFVKIFQFGSNGFLENIKVKQQSDLANLIIILVILRLSYQSIFKNDIIKNKEMLDSTGTVESILLSNPISLDVIDVVDRYLKEFNCVRRQSFEVLQAFLMRRVYKKVGAEEGDGPQSWDAQAFNGLIINMAIANGLNRDPDYYYDNTLSERDKLLRRKVWYFLVNLDIASSLSFSYSLCISKDDYDTKLPTLKTEASNIDDYELEKKVIQSFSIKSTILEPLSDLCQEIGEFESRKKVNQMLIQVNDLENLILKNLGTVGDYTSSKKGRQDFLKITKFQLNLYLSPLLVLLKHTILYGAISFTIRLYSTLRTLKRDPLFEENYNKIISHREFVELLTRIIGLNAKTLKQNIKFFGVLSRRYFCAWKSRKVHVYGVELISNESIYDFNPKMTDRAKFNYSINHFKEFESIFEQYLTRLTLSSSLNINLTVTNEDYSCLKATKINEFDPKNITIRMMEMIQNDHFWLQISKSQQETDTLSNAFKSELEQTSPSSDINPALGGNLLHEYFDMFGSTWSDDNIFDDLNPLQ
ncbi:hypothetical protein HYPBUDRAFT_150063 [Hyphopichia burtonii NRRL Y-1933]|uniref:Zn(2)-C6 fungal-type domain-containing protein n=1 Tax=Hyphopichia burtonii NRRL Y-1933 TaxID=984485 RepID=A0A1E4RDT6_9ASCO|nr:hypothetical protein HYPBUDRAFT_150063 [Hyphopichia burtonii NRRL Y-1933]ODV65410.1 hypothetical protein HYPBUDRAFT_150063 [Hyphopichia burtonii NRRL Y-1933]